ncbi:beta/gamma crystallin domain-containing protein [Streptomyces sp. NPDC054949]|uniref:beta/gamma crystallin domain-containing protein n=1 Tax=unclassified Streptomyces TaxID=2593676 RepID=UPI00099B33BA|nr:MULTISPECIES: beta/gamma crystallin domain-containing protein [unclassified Streptomyces]MCX5077649.1 hypothetical protein [Streptomyces sp. NBC_00424]
MNQRAKRVALSALTTVMAAASLTVATTPQASAIDNVPCSTGEFLWVHVNLPYRDNSDETWCYANAGAQDFSKQWWVTRISTGNNRVQYRDGNDRWAPDGSINKWTVYHWPWDPKGVHIRGIRIH